MNCNVIIKPGQVVKKVLITKDESEENGHMELNCEVFFDDDETGIEYIIGHKWDWNNDEYICCELEDDEYPRGIYEYKNDEYIQIENWDE
jgi:hypothetical protein